MKKDRPVQIRVSEEEVAAWRAAMVVEKSTVLAVWMRGKLNEAAARAVAGPALQASEPVKSRSVQRREAIQRGEPPPTFIAKLQDEAERDIPRAAAAELDRRAGSSSEFVRLPMTEGGEPTGQVAVVTGYDPGTREATVQAAVEGGGVDGDRGADRDDTDVEMATASRCSKHKFLEPCPRREGKPGPC